MAVKRVAQLVIECPCGTRIRDNFTMIGLTSDLSLYIEGYCWKCSKKVQRLISHEELLEVASSIMPKQLSKEDEEFLRQIGILLRKRNGGVN